MVTRKSPKKKTRRTKEQPTKSIDELVGYVEDGETITPPELLENYVVCFYGESGAGKTSTMSNVEGTYIIQCDPNRRGLAVRQTNIPQVALAQMKKNSHEHTPWDVIVATIDKIVDDPSIEMVVVDNMDIFYQAASNHYCLKNNVDNLLEMEDFGASWKNVDEMYKTQLQRIVNSGRGVFFITHKDEKEEELPSGAVITQTRPAVAKRVMKFIREHTDFAFYLGYEDDGSRSVLIRSPGNDVWTKCCVDEKIPHFYDPDGNPVNKIPAGDSPAECWANIQKSWNNELFDMDKVKKERVKGRRKKKVSKK
jgi:hypothetical protein